MFRQLILLMTFLMIPGFAEGASLLQKTVSERYSDLPSAFTKAKTAKERKAVYEAFARRVEDDLRSMPEDFPESQVDTAAAYVELHSYLKEVPAEDLTAVGCPKAPQRVLRLSNPQALEEGEGTAVGQFLIQIVKSACQP